MALTKKNMPETMYRASRCFRVLGNPTAYLTLKVLGENRKTTTELSKEIGVPVTTMSSILKNLRQVDLVRYEAFSGKTEYWVKDPEIITLLDKSEDIAREMGFKVE